MDFRCLIGRHDVGPGSLRPRLIGVRVEWLRWERACVRQTFGAKPWRCRHVEQRWFRVKVPRTYQGRGIGRAITAEAYLKRIGFTAPDPERLTASVGPPQEAFKSVAR